MAAISGSTISRKCTINAINGVFVDCNFCNECGMKEEELEKEEDEYKREAREESIPSFVPPKDQKTNLKTPKGWTQQPIKKILRSHKR
jgi:hypothetical protein